MVLPSCSVYALKIEYWYVLVIEQHGVVWSCSMSYIVSFVFNLKCVCTTFWLHHKIVCARACWCVCAYVGDITTSMKWSRWAVSNVAEQNLRLHYTWQGHRQPKITSASQKQGTLAINCTKTKYTEFSRDPVVRIDILMHNIARTPTCLFTSLQIFIVCGMRDDKETWHKRCWRLLKRSYCE